MKKTIIMLLLMTVMVAEASEGLVAKGRAKLGVGGTVNIGNSTDSYGLGVYYRKFINDRFALGGSALLSGEAGNVLAGYGAGLAGDFYIYRSDSGGAFVGLEMGYFRRSRFLNSSKETIWDLSAELTLGYDHFLNKNIAITPVFFYTENLDEKKSDFFRVLQPQGGVRVQLTFFL